MDGWGIVIINTYIIGLTEFKHEDLIINGSPCTNDIDLLN